MPWNPEHYMKTKEVVKILEENKITNVGEDTPYSNGVMIHFTDKEVKKVLHIINLKEDLGLLEVVDELLVKKLREKING